MNGALVSVLTNSRMGLSAHLAGVQNGMVFLIYAVSADIIVGAGLVFWGLRSNAQVASA